MVQICADALGQPIFIHPSRHGSALGATILGALAGRPKQTGFGSTSAAIKAVAGVLDVHDLHVWMVGPGVVACSCHIVVAEQSIREGQQVVREVVPGCEVRNEITVGSYGEPTDVEKIS